MYRPENVLEFWFPEGHDESVARHKQQLEWWFRGGADSTICARYVPILEAAIRGELDAWAETPRGRLALIIVLDQFSRSAFRNSPRTWAQDARAQALSIEGIARGDLETLSTAERIFYALPFGHSENLELQERSVAIAEETLRLARADLRPLYEFGLSQARGHRDVITRFGRHPHRNAVLGRESTPEEREYLATVTPVHQRAFPD